MDSVVQPISGVATTEDAAAIRRAVVACAIGQVFAIFATFAVGFLMRPVGAMVIGWYGDRFGRRKALVVTVGLMAVATGLTGLIPPYASIGLLGPILLVVCRMLQGFSTG